MRLIKNDPNYNECWPRAVVPYKRIYGIDEPATLPRLANDGKLSKHLPEGTPFGLVGTSSFYKRETLSRTACVPEGQVTATYAGRQRSLEGPRRRSPATATASPLNWHNQGADAGLYANERHPRRPHPGDGADDRSQGRQQRPALSQPRRRTTAHPRRDSAAQVRPDAATEQPLDPDGNPDTSFLAKIPADVGVHVPDASTSTAWC